jgi:hypothetical protein
MKRIVLAIPGVAAIAVSAWAQTPVAKPDEKTLADAIELHSSKARMPGRVEIRGRSRRRHPASAPIQGHGVGHAASRDPDVRQ